MSIGINSYLNNNYYGNGSVNKGSTQYKNVVKNELADIIAEEAMMSPEEKMLYELLGGREAHMKNRMKLYDSDGNLLNGYGVAGMCVNGKSLSECHQIINISDEYRQKMFELTKKEYIRENGVANGDTTQRTSLYTEFQKSIKIDDRLKGSWTLGQYEKAYTKAFYNAVKASNPNWQIGQPFDASVLDNVTRESIESSLVKGNGTYGEILSSKGIDYSI